MAAVSVLRAGLRKHLSNYWTEFSRTAIGDIVTAAAAISFVSLIFVACSLALIALFYAVSLMLNRIG
jgi:hypothetical protein